MFAMPHRRALRRRPCAADQCAPDHPLCSLDGAQRNRGAHRGAVTESSTALRSIEATGEQAQSASSAITTGRHWLAFMVRQTHHERREGERGRFTRTERVAEAAESKGHHERKVASAAFPEQVEGHHKRKSGEGMKPSPHSLRQINHAYTARGPCRNHHRREARGRC